MLYFSARRKLGLLVEQWMLKNRVLNCPSSTIGFLQIHGFLNEEKIKEFLAKEDVK